MNIPLNEHIVKVKDNVPLFTCDSNKTFAMFLVVAISTTLLTQSINVNSYAETGQGSDVFRVIMTVFGVENNKGDVITIVTVIMEKDQE